MCIINMERFTIVSSQEINTVVVNAKSTHTVRNNNWCMKLYRDWSEWRNTNGTRTVPTLEELWTSPKSELAGALKHFVFEIRRHDGSEYPPNTLYNIICGINRLIKENRPQCNIIDKNDPEFVYLVRSLDAKMKDLTARGIGGLRRTADPITGDDETKLWKCGAFSTSKAQGLLRAVYFYTSKAFGLRGRDEHRKLSLDQIKFGQDSAGKFVQFQGRGNKVYKGGINDCKMEAKCIKQYDTEGNCRSIYKILEQYVSCLHDAGIIDGAFYRRPLASILPKPRFGVTPVGINSLSKLLPEAAKMAGIETNITSHSGKVSCATQLFRENVDEQLIMGRTGHRTTAALRLYKRKADEQDVELSRMLEPPPVPLLDCFHFE